MTQAVANDFVIDEGVVQRGDVRALDVFSAHIPGRGVTVLSGPSAGRQVDATAAATGWMCPRRDGAASAGKDMAGLDSLPLRRQVGMASGPRRFRAVRDNLLTASPDAGHADWS